MEHRGRFQLAPADGFRCFILFLYQINYIEIMHKSNNVMMRWQIPDMNVSY